jgi:hypothetical protein
MSYASHETSEALGSMEYYWRFSPSPQSTQPNAVVGTNLKVKNMFRANLIVLALFLAWALSKTVRCAPKGYEDETGFHFA